jgi:ribosomal-protein-alanine N-acetyltransferase
MSLNSQNERELESVTLRTYRTGDAGAMYALDVVCFEQQFRFSRRAMRGFAEAKNAVTALAEAGGELVGFCIAEVEERVGYVVTLDVAPAWRRNGLAALLMTELERRTRAAGAGGMALHVFTGNLGAIRFYEAIGYERVGIAQGFYGRGLDGLVYRNRFEE